MLAVVRQISVTTAVLQFLSCCMCWREESSNMQKYIHQMTEYITDVFHPKAMPCILEQGCMGANRLDSLICILFYIVVVVISHSLPPSWLWLLACVKSSCQHVDLVHSRLCLVAVLTLSFSLVISQLEQFLDTEVLFHHKSEPQDSGLKFLHFNPTYAANCKHRAKATLLLSVFFCLFFFLTCCRLQKGGGWGWGGWGVGVGGVFCAYSPRTQRGNDDHLIVKNGHFPNTSLHFWIADCVMI